MSNATTSFKKRFPKLDYKAVSVVMIAKSEKMKMKKSHLPLIFWYFLHPPSLPLWVPLLIFLKSVPQPYPILWKFHSPLKKKEEGERKL